MKRRDFIKKSTGVLAGASATAAMLPNIGVAAGKKVESMQLLTANASFDPVRPEIVRG